jgi:hypothetical protein
MRLPGNGTVGVGRGQPRRMTMTQNAGDMTVYKVSGLTVQSNIPLPELPQVDDREDLCVFQLLPGQSSLPAALQWFHQWVLSDGTVWLALAKYRSGYLLRFPDLADFLVSADGKQIRCYPNPDSPVETIRHLFLDQVIPLLLSQWGKLVLHASAVATPEGAIAFAGMTGMGKSTLTASFAEQGFALLTDDCLLLEEKGGALFATPSYPGLRLWDDVTSVLFARAPAVSQMAHYTDKKRLGVNNGWLRFCPDAVALLRIYILPPPEEVSRENAIQISPLPPREAFSELIRYAFRLDITDRNRLREEFESLSRVVALPLFYRLAFPRDLLFLSAVREAILENLSER